MLTRDLNWRNEIRKIAFIGAILVSDQTPTEMIHDDRIGPAENAQLVKALDLGRKTKGRRRATLIPNHDPQFIQDFLRAKTPELLALVSCRNNLR